MSSVTGKGFRSFDTAPADPAVAAEQAEAQAQQLAQVADLWKNEQGPMAAFFQSALTEMASQMERTAASLRGQLESKLDEKKEPEKYTVAGGDTMVKIAEKHGVPLKELIKANPQIKNPDKIHPGQELNLPSGAEKAEKAEKKQKGTPAPDCQPVDGGKYTVAPGDTMAAIAKKYGVPVKELIKANPKVKNPNVIHPGPKLELPEGAKAEQKDDAKQVATQAKQGASQAKAQPAKKKSSAAGGAD